MPDEDIGGALGTFNQAEPPEPQFSHIGRPLIAIVGPTAAGKSALAIALAQKLNGEVLNYDSVQLYRGFDIDRARCLRQNDRELPITFSIASTRRTISLQEITDAWP